MRSCWQKVIWITLPGCLTQNNIVPCRFLLPFHFFCCHFIRQHRISDFEGSSGERSLFDGSCRIFWVYVLDWTDCCWLMDWNFLRFSQCDPVLGNIREPELGGITIYPNVVLGVITIAIAIVGYWLTSQTKSIDQYR